MEGREREDAERRQSKTEPSTASTVSPSQSRESRFDGDVVGETAGSATAGDAPPAETAVKAEGERRPSNVASDSRVSGRVDVGAGRVADDDYGGGWGVLDLRVGKGLLGAACLTFCRPR